MDCSQSPLFGRLHGGWVVAYSAVLMIIPAGSKYKPFPVIDLPDRRWPSRTLDHAPIWCSVDLRDGNQALPVPMNVAQKLDLFKTLVKVGFKQIEIGFPAASNTEFEFTRRLIEENLIPDDVTVQVLVQARRELIERTAQALQGSKRAIIHLYNSTSPAQRRIVFGLHKAAILDIAVQGTRAVKDNLPVLSGTDVMFEYSPESFSATEPDFALEVCEAVMQEWGPTPEKPMILNLPDTVEVAMCNVHADQIEWFIRNLKNRDAAIISVHTHNDRGTGTAATELSLLAGAQRVEGTLFGNGERTGNLDIITVALNLYTQGVDPGLDFSDINGIREVYERTTGMEVPQRQPYSGELVFTAFSGSHQDAIKKGFAAMEKAGADANWDVPYLIIDPADLGREYREVIRVNSQSGKGGMAYLLESEHGIFLPRTLQIEFSRIANDIVDGLGREVTADEIKAFFWKEYIDRTEPYSIKHFHADGAGGLVQCRASMLKGDEEQHLTGEGNGPIAAFVNALQAADAPGFEVVFYSEHSLGSGSTAAAIAYIQIKTETEKNIFGAGVDTNIEMASIRAILSALNRSLR